MKNKGFSLVELIVVIAIMAILAGVLSPLLVKYINRSRLSKDMNAGNDLAKAIMVVITEEDVRDNADEHSEPCLVSEMGGSDFKDAVFAHLSVTELVGSAKYDVNGELLQNGKPQYYYTLDAAKNKVEVYLGGTDESYRIYPVAGNKFTR